MPDAFCGKRSLRTALVLVGVVGCLLLAVAAPAGAEAGQAPAQSEPGSGDPYADLLVTTATSELRLPWQSLPPVLSVLGTKAATRQATLAYLQAAQAQDDAAALRAAYEAAVEAAARQGPAASAAVRRAASRCGSDFDCFKACTLDIESDGNYGAVSPGGKYRGAWQFDQSTWDGAVARAGYPEWSGHDPATSPPGIQDAAARQLYAERGNQPWGGRC